MLRFFTAGESHGKGLVVIVEGLPAGLEITKEEIQGELARRRLGYGRGPRMRFEQDELTLIAGIRHGRTLGSPVALEIGNTEWPKWEQEMSPDPGRSEKILTQPRPGHAELVGMQKYGFDDARDILERASARETVARTAAGCLAKALLAKLGVAVISHVIQLGGISVGDAPRPRPEDLEKIDESKVRVFDPNIEDAMVEEIKAAAKAGDSLGGAAEVLVFGTPIGLGSHVHWDRKLDGLLAQGLMSIQAIKAVSIGEGHVVSGLRGSEAHDSIRWDQETKTYVRDTLRAGGIEGGMSTGGLISVTAWMKPLSTLNRPVIKTVDVVTKEETVSFKERTDVTAVPAMGVVAEAMVALVLATEAVRKFGGDSVAEMVRNYESFNAHIHETPSASKG